MLDEVQMRREALGEFHVLPRGLFGQGEVRRVSCLIA